MGHFVESDSTDIGIYRHSFVLSDEVMRGKDAREVGEHFWQGVRWCQEQFGPCDGLYDRCRCWTIHSPRDPRIIFMSKTDAATFKMRWC